MTQTHTDAIRFLKKPLWICLLSLITCLLLLSHALLHWQQARQQLHEQQQQLTQAQQQQQQIARSRQIYQQHRPQYQQLHQQGLFQSHPETQWLSALIQLESDYPDLNWQYQLGPARQINPEQPHYQIYHNPLTIELKPRHAQQFIHFMTDLQSIAGWLQFAQCRLQRQHPGQFPALSARCQLYWISISLPEGTS